MASARAKLHLDEHGGHLLEDARWIPRRMLHHGRVGKRWLGVLARTEHRKGLYRRGVTFAVSGTNVGYGRYGMVTDV
jgi:hypothetical protein